MQSLSLGPIKVNTLKGFYATIYFFLLVLKIFVVTKNVLEVFHKTLTLTARPLTLN
jgi:hypothetical protein